jgi:GlpG protein
MRQIGTLADERQVQRLGDYLLTQGIRVQVDQSEGGFAIWALDEDRVAKAREELNQFIQNPGDERYLAAERDAGRIRDELIRKEKERRRRIVDVRRQWTAPRARPLTFLLIVICCALAFATDFGDKKDGAAWQALIIASYEHEGDYIRYYPVFTSGSDVARGQVWRLVTPIFLHANLMHLLMNMMAMSSLSTLIEVRRGTWRLAFLVLTTAIVSNLAQYLYSGPGFCGISGVALGLFGYAWMKSEFDPSAGIAIPRSSVIMMLVFVGLCFTPLIGQIANAAHIAGLVSGMLLGYGPVVFRRIAGR